MHGTRLMTGRELAERLRVSPDTIRHWVRIGRIPVVRYSGRVHRFDLEAVLAALSSKNGGCRNGE